MPILLRHYLKLGGRIAAFNVDPQFSNVVDGLIFVDMLHVDPRILARLIESTAPVNVRACVRIAR